MSDAALERAYEEDLQAAARYLEVWVTYRDGRRVKRRTFLDTPEGRQSAAKNADTWYELLLVERVDVVPVGADSGSAKIASGGVAVRPAAPTRTTCCRHVMLKKPSGRRLCHSLTCPDQPGEPIAIAREHAQGRNWPPYGRRLR